MVFDCGMRNKDGKMIKYEMGSSIPYKNENYYVEGWRIFFFLVYLLANSIVERCRSDDLMSNVTISCLPPSRVECGLKIDMGMGIAVIPRLTVDPEVQKLKVIIDCPHPAPLATYRPPPFGRWSKWPGNNDTEMSKASTEWNVDYWIFASVTFDIALMNMTTVAKSRK